MNRTTAPWPATTSPVDALLARLEGVRPNGKGYAAKCPAHEDRLPSLSVTAGDDGRALLHCHAGCTAADICAAVGLEVKDLFPPKANGSGRANGHARPVTAKVYRYVGADGEVLFEVVRTTPKGFRQRRPDGNGGHVWNLDGVQRILYRLPDLIDADPGAWVFVTEGEKDADRLAAAGLVATTNPGGAGKWRTEYGETLRGRRVAVLPDNDTAGRAHADHVARSVHATAADVRLVSLPGLPAKGDVSDWLDAGGTAEELVRLAEIAPRFTPSTRVDVDTNADSPGNGAFVSTSTPTPQMRRRPSPPWVPFPVHLLPNPIGDYVRSVADSVGCDVALVALPMLAATGAAIGNARTIRLKSDWREPPVVWAVPVADSGAAKSPALERATRPMQRRQARLFKAHAQAQAAYAEERKRWKAEPKDQRGEEPEPPPPCERLVVSDTTVEAVADRLLAAPRGLLLSRDELSGWFGSFGQYNAKGNRGADVGNWLSMHGARELVVDRKTGDVKTIHVPRAAVSVTGTIQPGTLRRVLSAEFYENGLAARLLLAMPPRRPKVWTEEEVDPVLEQRVNEVFDALLSLKTGRDLDGDPEPLDVPLDGAAKSAWVAFVNECGADQAAHRDERLVAAWSKIEGYGARLALIIHTVRVAAGDTSVDPDRIDVDSVAAGIELARWFGREAERVYAILAETEDEQARRELCELIKSKGGSVSTRDLLRCTRQFATAGAAETALRDLADAGLGRWVKAEPSGDRGRPADPRFALTTGVDVDRNTE